MKAKRRHDLKHNALDAELVKILEYIKKHVAGIVFVILVIVAAIWIGLNLYERSETAVSIPRRDYDHLKSLNISTADGRSTALAGFEELTNQTGEPRIAAMACVEAGDICMRQQVAGDFVSGAIDKAQKHYQRVLDEFSDNKSATGRAHFGLARLAEGKGNFEVARDHYQQVVTIGEKTSLLALNSAKAALKVLGELEKPIRLATTRPAPPATPPAIPTTQPTTQPATAP
ncbi:MAG: tetratricopeptide repeat protein [Phycisphaerae bacterium]|jgi:tetratricopeptide (TPR) repeat protein|nr:tetratricopeptide repeat protein [Phycisphaerae bacterium]